MRFCGNLALILTTLGLVSTMAACSGHEDRNSSTRPSISQMDAEGVLDRAVGLAQAKDFDGLCQTIAAAEHNCRAQLDQTRRMNQLPGADFPKIVGVESKENDGAPTVTLNLEGVLLDGKPYASDFVVIYSNDKGLTSTTSIYWAGIQGASSPVATSSSVPA